MPEKQGTLRFIIVTACVVSTVVAVVRADSADVTCWCPDGSNKSQEHFSDVCQAAAERSTEGKCTGGIALIRGFSGTFDDEVIKALEEGELYGDACGEASTLQCTGNSIVVAQEVQDSWNLKVLAVHDGDDPAAEEGLPHLRHHGSGVTIYLLDTGIQEIHPAFQYLEALRPAGAAGNASRVMPGASMLEVEELGGCVTHGTSTAAVAAGIEYGVSQNATIVPVEVLGCGGTGRSDAVLRGLNWVAEMHKAKGGPAVVQLSLVAEEINEALDAGAEAMVAMGLTVVVAAGNYGSDVSGYSPARAQGVIAVGAMDRSNRVWTDSNRGSGVAMFAPGHEIPTPAVNERLLVDRRLPVEDNGLGLTPDLVLSSGTSFAASHVTGVVAQRLEHEPEVTPEQVLQHLMDNAHMDTLDGAGLSPNVMLGFAHESIAEDFTRSPSASPDDVSVTVDDPELVIQALDQPLSASPASLPPVVLHELETATRKVGITNAGDVPVKFSVSQRVTGLFGGWLSVTPENGSIPPRSTTELDVECDATDLYQGRYMGSIIVTTEVQQVMVSTIMYSFCEELRTNYWQPPEVEYPEENLIILENRPLWDSSPAAADEVVWLEVPFRFNLPVYAVPAAAFADSDGVEVVEVVRTDGRGSMCSDFAARVRATVDPWKRASTTVCITLKGQAVRSADNKTAMPEASHCSTVDHQPHGRLFGVFMAHSNDAGLVTSKQQVTILAIFSEPLDVLTFRSSSFIIQGPMDAQVISLDKINSSGTHWHVAIDIGEHMGEVKVGIIDSGVQDLSGRHLAPVPVLSFHREKYIPFESTGYHVNVGLT